MQRISTNENQLDTHRAWQAHIIDDVVLTPNRKISFLSTNTYIQYMLIPKILTQVNYQYDFTSSTQYQHKELLRWRFIVQTLSYAYINYELDIVWPWQWDVLTSFVTSHRHSGFPGDNNTTSTCTRYFMCILYGGTIGKSIVHTV